MKKRLISLLLAFSMMLTFLPAGAVSAFANNGSIFTDANQIEYKLNDTTMTATVIGSDRRDWPANKTVEIPSYVGNNGEYKVTAIEHDAFNTKRTIAGQLIIPDTVTSIGSYAFFGCDKLTGDLSIPNGVTTISTFAFYGCTGLTGTLTLPDTVTTIETKAFSGCSGLTKLVLSKKLKTIGENAFSSCSSLKGDLEIPESVTTIGNSAFSSCTSLDGKITIPGSIVSIGNYAFSSCSQVKSVEILDGVTRIGAHAFETCTSLSDLKIPSSVKTIENNAFNGCSSLTGNPPIPEGVKKVGNYAFNACRNLSGKLELPSTVTSIGISAFGGPNSLTGEVEIGETVKYIDKGILSLTGVNRFRFPKNLCDTEIKENAFATSGSSTKIYYPGYKAEWDETRVRNNTIEGLQADGLSISGIPVCYLCNVTFNPNGGVFADGISAPKTIEGIYRTEKVATKGEVPTVAARKGYRFDGWYYTDNVARAMTAFDPATEGVPDTITLYAAWRQTDTLATVAISGLSDGDTLVKGKEYPFTVKITPDGDAGNGKLTLTLANGGTLYQQKDDGTWEEMTSSELDIALVSKSYQFKLVPDQTGPNTLTAGVQKDGLTGAPNTDEVSFTVRDYEDGTVTIEGLEDAVIKEGESKDFTVKVDPKDDAKLGEAVIDFGGKNGEIEYKDKNGEYKLMPEGGLKIDLGSGETEYEFRITPKETGKQTLTAAVKQDEKKLAKDEKDFAVSEMPILTLKDGVITSVTVPGKDGADPEDITEIVKKNANEDGSFNVPEGATVSVAFDKDAFADSGLKFGHWDITGLDDPNAYQNKESFDFVMPAKGVTLKAMTQDASIEDDEPDIVGPIVIGTTVVVGGAVLGYQAYSLGAEFAGKLMALPYFPSNRSALAMMLWEDAGKPMPESELLYPDVGQEERDMDLQHAARWAMENELIPDLNDEGTAPEEMKFYPDNAVSKIDVLKAWQKAQELKQNA